MSGLDNTLDSGKKIIDIFDMDYKDDDGDTIEGDLVNSIDAVESSFISKDSKDPVENVISTFKDMGVQIFPNEGGLYDTSVTWFMQKEKPGNGPDALFRLGAGWTDEEKEQIISAIRGDTPITESDDYSEDDDIDEDLFTKDAETDREFNVADYKKENMFKRFGTMKGLVQQYYNMIDGAFNGIDDVTNLLKAIYEIVARRYFEAKRLRDFPALREWEKLISEIPDINVAGATFEGASDEYGISEEVYVLAQKWWNKINSTRNAVAMVMAITLLIEKLVQDQDNPEAADLLDVKEELDEELLDKVHSDGRAQVAGVYSAR